MSDIEKEPDRKPKWGNDKKAKKDKIATEAKKILKGALKDSYDDDPQIVLLIAILEELQK